MSSIIVFDCEFLTAPGAPMRFWCGPNDPDPVIVQIGAVRLNLTGDFAMTDQFRQIVIPVDRHGNRYPLDPLFTKLTGITEQDVSDTGVPLQTALEAFDVMSAGDRIWSWGKDEMNMIAISCYIAGIPPVIPAQRFGNACTLLRAAGMPVEDIHKTRSNTLAAYYDLELSHLRGHDALDDALSVAHVLQLLLRDGRLDPKEVVAS